MDENLDLLLVRLPPLRSDADFASWFSSSGKSALSDTSGAQDIAAFRIVKGDPGFSILLRMKLRPLVIPTAVQIVNPFCDLDERPIIGQYRFAGSFTGASAGEPVKATALIGRAAGTNSLEEFRAWYDEDHMCALAAVPGVISATRYEVDSDDSRSLAVYEFADPDVQSGEAWHRAGNTAWTRRIRTRYVRWFDMTLTPLKPVDEALA